MKFLKQLGANYVFDTTFARDFALTERYFTACAMCLLYAHILFIVLCVMNAFRSAREFLRRYKKTKDSGNVPMLASACPGML